MAGGSARDEMVDAAERLIAQQGLAAVSLRHVQMAAGQRNKSAANYHFGTREGLIDAVIQARMAPINQRRLGMLADLDSSGRGRDVRALVEALVVPLAEATLHHPPLGEGSGGSHYARFLAQLLVDPATVELARRHLWAESFRAVCGRLAERLTQVPPELRGDRIDRVAGLLIVSLAAWEGGWIGGDPPAPVEARIADLVETCVAMVEAPASAPASPEASTPDRELA